jgi:tetratricopeptide (TPR) repeat protein
VLLRDALELQKHQDNEDENIDLMYVLISMGSVLLRTAQPEEALAYVMRARQIGEKVFGPDHVVLSRALIVEAAVYRSMGRTAEAGIAARRALAVLRDDARPLLHVAWEEYARVLRQAGRRTEAKTAENLARKIREDLQKDNPARHRVDTSALKAH